MKTLFKNGTIFDGSGEKPYVGDVLIEDDRILEVGGKITAEADKTVDGMSETLYNKHIISNT